MHRDNENRRPDADFFLAQAEFEQTEQHPVRMLREDILRRQGVETFQETALPRLFRRQANRDDDRKPTLFCTYNLLHRRRCKT